MSLHKERKENESKAKQGKARRGETRREKKRREKKNGPFFPPGLNWPILWHITLI